MSWQLTIKSPDGSSTRATYTDAAPGGILNGFEWMVRGDGIPLQLQFWAKPSLVDIQPRDIVALEVDGSPAFWGVAVKTWPADETGEREYVVLGGTELLKHRIYNDPDSYSSQDIAAIARDVIDRFRPPAVTYDSALIPNVGLTLALPSPYRLEVGAILEALARSGSSAGITWGVDAEGRARFGVVSGTTEVAYDEADVRWQRVNAQDVITRADLLLATQDSPAPNSATSYILVAGVPVPTRDYGSRPIVVSESSSDDPIYGVQRAFMASGLLVVNGSPDSIHSSNNITNAADSIDGSDSTYAYNTAAGDANLVFDVPKEAGAYGVEVYYALASGKRMVITVTYVISSGFWFGRRRKTRYVIDSHTSEKQTARMLVLPPANMDEDGGDIYVGLYAYDLAAANDWKVYEVRTIRIDRDRAHDYARSLLRSPVQRPAVVTLQRYSTPTPRVKIAGAPGGDLEYEVKRWRYRWIPGALQTTAELGDRADDDLTLAIGRVASANQADALYTSRGLTEVRSV